MPTSKFDFINIVYGVYSVYVCVCVCMNIINKKTKHYVRVRDLNNEKEHGLNQRAYPLW